MVVCLNEQTMQHYRSKRTEIGLEIFRKNAPKLARSPAFARHKNERMATVTGRVRPLDGYLRRMVAAMGAYIVYV